MPFVVHERHPETLREHLRVEALARALRKRHAAVALAGAFGLYLPAGAPLEFRGCDPKLLEDHLTRAASTSPEGIPRGRSRRARGRGRTACSRRTAPAD